MKRNGTVDSMQVPDLSRRDFLEDGVTINGLATLKTSIAGLTAITE
jgi:hypothetical protein